MLRDDVDRLETAGLRSQSDALLGDAAVLRAQSETLRQLAWNACEEANRLRAFSWANRLARTGAAARPGG